MLFLTFPVACNDWGGIKFVLLFADLLYLEVLVKVQIDILYLSVDISLFDI